MTASTDMDVIAPSEALVTVAGVECRVKRIKLRELMLLARVLTAGVGTNLADIKLNEDGAEEQLIALLVMAIPEAGVEVCDLLRAVVEPQFEPPADEKAEKEQQRARAAVNAEMRNPDPEVALDILGIVASQEKDSIPLLLGKARTVFGQVTALYRTGKKDS